MRLIDADSHECWACVHHIDGKCDTFCDHGESFEPRVDVLFAPVAYNVEVVVKELQATNKNLCDHIICCKEKHCEICTVNNFLSKQIEIIRKGGVNNG